MATQLREDGLAGLGEVGLALRDDAVRLPAEEPEAALLVEAAEVAHAVPEAVLVLDLRERRLLGPGVVAPRDDGAADGDLADLARGREEVLRPASDRIVRDLDDLDLDLARGSPDARPEALLGEGARLREDLLAPDRRHGERLGGAVGRVDLRAALEHTLEALEHRGNGRSPGRDHPPERGELLKGVRGAEPLAGARGRSPRTLEARDAPEERGRAEHARHAALADRVNDVVPIHEAGPREVHLRDHGRHAERRVEQGEERERREVDLVGREAVGRAERPHLGVEVPVSVDRALGDARAPGREEDRGRLVGPRVDRRVRPGVRAKIGELVSAPEPAAADRDVHAHAR